MTFGAITVLMLDVDGVLTDGRLAYGADSELFKCFSTLDGVALKQWHRASGRSAIITGRKHPCVQRRATELGVTWVRDGVHDKAGAYRDALEALDAADANVCYVGDDIPDLPPLRQCAFPVAVGNAARPLKSLAAYVTRRHGGDGAVAEVVELLLRKQGRWSRELFHGI
jgi:3-deoxy-D-manno-octulosonate 8-phosphate phosphatase (KDO 8-P phosphatase)